MPRAKHFLDIDVVEAARQRIAHLYDAFDDTVVMYSGGKDSLVTLLLVKEYHDAHNLGPVKVAFRHEEVINPSVLEFVAKFRDYDWCDLYWFCLPMANSKFSLGVKERYTEWDPEREWVGEMPEWAITADDLDMHGNDFNQNNVDDYIANHIAPRGKVAFITGVRASESLVRFRAVTQKLNENYINSIEGNTRSRVKLCKPIYDWEQIDVLKFILESDEDWCPVYDAQDIAGIGLRVSTALHVVAARKFKELAEVEPEFYQSIVDIFPDMQDQARYWNDFDQDAILKDYKGQGWNGVMRYIRDHVPEDNKALAKSRVKLWRGRHENDPENYPIDLLLRNIAFGTIKQRMAGVYVDSKSHKGEK